MTFMAIEDGVKESSKEEGASSSKVEVSSCEEESSSSDNEVTSLQLEKLFETVAYVRSMDKLKSLKRSLGLLGMAPPHPLLLRIKSKTLYKLQNIRKRMHP